MEQVGPIAAVSVASPLPEQRRGGSAWLLLGGLALAVLTCVAVTFPGQGDVGLWESWIGNARTLGVVAGFRENHADYPPLANVVLASAAALGSAVGVSDTTAIKLSLLAFLVITLALFFAWTRRFPLVLAMWAAVLLNSVMLGYLDIYVAPFVLMGIWALTKGRPTAAMTSIGAATLIKWQPILIAPFVIVHVWRTNAKRAALTAVPAVALAVLVAVVFGVLPVANAFALSLQHGSLSSDALNLGQVMMTWPYFTARWWVPAAMKVAFMCQFLWLIVRYADGPAHGERAIAYALVAFLGYVVCSSGVHENHWFVPTVLALALASMDRMWWMPALAIAVVSNVNLVTSYESAGPDVTAPIAALVVVGYVWSWRLLARAEGRWSPQT
jgi:hypothetical protein